MLKFFLQVFSNRAGINWREHEKEIFSSENYLQKQNLLNFTSVFFLLFLFLFFVLFLIK